MFKQCWKTVDEADEDSNIPERNILLINSLSVRLCMITKSI